MGELVATPTRWAQWAVISLPDGEVYVWHPDGVLISPRCIHVAGDTYRRTRELFDGARFDDVDQALYFARLVPHVVHDARGGERTLYFVRSMEWAERLGTVPDFPPPQSLLPDARDVDRPYSLHERFNTLRACIITIADMPERQVVAWTRALVPGWCLGPSCRVCGCSEADACWPPCGWAERDLCTRCSAELGSMRALWLGAITLAVVVMACGVLDAGWGLPPGAHLSVSAGLLVVLGACTRRLRRQEVV